MTSARWAVLACTLLLGLAAGASATEAPVPLRPRETWWETMLATREALAEQEAAAT